MPSVYVHGPSYAYAFETLTISTAAVGCTAATIKVIAAGTGAPGDHAALTYTREACEAFVTCESQAVRYRWDGTDPTSSVGHILNPGDTLTIEGYDNIKAFRAIRKDAADSTLQVTYSRRS